MDDKTYVQLLQAIREHSGMELEQIREAGEHGADAGWAGFTYTADCVDFYDENHEAIWELAAQMADDCGYKNVPELVATFNCSDMADTEDGFKNALAWFTLEEVGRYSADRRYDKQTH